MWAQSVFPFMAERVGLKTALTGAKEKINYTLRLLTPPLISEDFKDFTAIVREGQANRVTADIAITFSPQCLDLDSGCMRGIRSYGADYLAVTGRGRRVFYSETYSQLEYAFPSTFHLSQPDSIRAFLSVRQRLSQIINRSTLTPWTTITFQGEEIDPYAQLTLPSAARYFGINPFPLPS